MSSRTFTAIGIDVGGTKIAGGRVTFPEGQPRGSRMLMTRPNRGGRAVLDDVVSLVREFSTEAASAGDSVDAIGIGVCELVDRQGRLASAHCVDWLDLPVVDELGQIAPVVLEADVRAAAVAESLFGAGRPYDTFLYITVGTGISCCLMLRGRPYLGAHGASGTMASSPLGVRCGRCGELGQESLEDIASGPALARRYRALGGQATEGREVLAAAHHGDPRAKDVVRSATASLGAQLGLLVNVLDPEALVVGGGLGLNLGSHWTDLIDATRHHIWSRAHRDLPILRCVTGVDAGWRGAAAAAWRAHVSHALSTEHQPPTEDQP